MLRRARPQPHLMLSSAGMNNPKEKFMLRRILESTWLALLMGAPTVPAQPATAPATRPAAANADTTTPKATLILMARGAVTGDAAAVRELFNATSPQQVKLADMLTQRLAVMARFRQSLVKAFGEDAATQIA